VPTRRSNSSSLLAPSLKENLEAGRCVAFVGAGFSMVCGMPNWSGLLRRLLDDAEKDSFNEQEDLRFRNCEWLLSHNSLPMAANILRDIVSEGDIRESLRKQFSVSILESCPLKIRARMKSRMRNLVNAPWAGFITTNYDQLIEVELNTRGKSFVASYSAGEPAMGALLSSRSQGPFVVKLHGSLDSGDLVLSTEEYDRAYLMKPQIAGFLSAVMLKYHLVFIGCSLEDEILRMRRKLFEDFGHQLPLAYALLPKSQDNLARGAWLKKWVGIESILYDPDDQHLAVDRFLKLASETEPNIDVGGADSIAELRRLSVAERMARIGQINLEFIRLLGRCSRREISHIDLVSLGRTETGYGSLESMSADERVYRMLYLVSIGLIRETHDGSGRRSYRLSRSVLSK